MSYTQAAARKSKSTVSSNGLGLVDLYMVHPVHIRTADLVDTARHEPMLQMSNVNLDLQFATGWKALLSAESMDVLHT